MKREFRYGLIMNGIGDLVVCENNVAYWYAIYLSHIELRAQRNTRQKITQIW
jgi:hypothetical protein